MSELMYRNRDLRQFWRNSGFALRVRQALWPEWCGESLS